MFVLQLTIVNLHVHTCTHDASADTSGDSYADGIAAGHDQSCLGWHHTDSFDQSHRSVNLKGDDKEATLKQSGLFCI
jgi:hypothetical protein